MELFKIKGGNNLEGIIKVAGSKNSATPIIAATLLTSQKCVLENVPRIKDVLTLLEIMQSMGSRFDWTDENTLEIENKNIDPEKISQHLVGKIRSSILLVGPLLARFGKFKMSSPGGCLIGARPVDTHLGAFVDMGAKVEKDGDTYIFFVKKWQQNPHIVLSEFSVTATENILMLAGGLASNRVTLDMAAAEPHVQDLIFFLKKMGAKISGAGTHTLVIEGNKKLKGVKHKLISDPIEAGTFLILSAIFRGKIGVEGVEEKFELLPMKKLEEFGVRFLRKKSGTKNIIYSLAKLPLNSPRVVQTMPHPGLPTDLQALFGLLSTQSSGTTLIHDTMFEGRLKYIDELVKMGANATILDPHRALIVGPTPLYGSIISSFDLRGGMTMILAALIARGETIINGIEQVDRGYENIDKRLMSLGANIERLKEIEN